MLDVRLSGGGLIAGQEIVALLRKLKVSAPIASYSKPFARVDLDTGHTQSSPATRTAGSWMVAWSIPCRFP